MFLKGFLFSRNKLPFLKFLEVSLESFYQSLVVFRVQFIGTDDMVSDVLNVENAMSGLKLEAVEMEPVVGGEFIIVEVNSKSELIFVDEFFALSTGTPVGFGVLNLKVLLEVSDVFSHSEDYMLYWKVLW